MSEKTDKKSKTNGSEAEKPFSLRLKGSFDGKTAMLTSFAHSGCQTCHGNFDLEIPFTVPSAGAAKQITTKGAKIKSKRDGGFNLQAKG